MPIGLLKRRGRPVSVPQPEPQAIEARDYTLDLHFRAKSSQGARMSPGSDAVAQLPAMLDGLDRSPIELVQPLPPELQEALPRIERTLEATQWLEAVRHLGPVGRYGMHVLVSLEAVDLAFETVALALLHGDLDAGGYPRYDALVGGVAAHWDEVTGDVVVRGVVGWGGSGLRADTDRTSRRILASLQANISATASVVAAPTVEGRAPSGAQVGLVCAHCGFRSGQTRAFYCPRCGLRLFQA